MSEVLGLWYELTDLGSTDLNLSMKIFLKRLKSDSVKFLGLSAYGLLIIRGSCCLLLSHGSQVDLIDPWRA